MVPMETMSADEITFGVEIETGVPSAVPFRIGSYHNGIPVSDAPRFEEASWKAERDGSIRVPSKIACEFVSPILHGADGVKNLLEMVEWIKSSGGKVNRTCGLHIHIGVRSVLGNDATSEQITDFVSKLAAVVNINTEAIYAQTGTRRDTGRFCQRLDASIRDNVRRIRFTRSLNDYYFSDRYRILNLRNISTRGTVEFRAFASTLNPDKVLHHLWTCLFIVKFAATLDRVPWTGRGWNSEEGGTGAKALKGFYHKIKRHCLVGEMANRYHSMKETALQMAEKFDLAM